MLRRENVLKNYSPPKNHPPTQPAGETRTGGIERPQIMARTCYRTSPTG